MKPLNCVEGEFRLIHLSLIYVIYHLSYKMLHFCFIANKKMKLFSFRSFENNWNIYKTLAFHKPAQTKVGQEDVEAVSVMM